MQTFDGANTYAVGDLHGSHSNICRGTSNWEDKTNCRDFDTLEEMDAALIKSINDTVSSSATLFILGDILFGDKSLLPQFLERINCKNLYLIYGNHDDFLMTDKYKHFQDLFIECAYYKEIKCTRKRGKAKWCILFHYPMKVWNRSHYKSYAITGHSHGSLPYADHELGIDIGWDIWKRPLSFHEIDDILCKKKWKAVDHHNERTN